MLASAKEKIVAALDGVVAANRERFRTYVGQKAVELLSNDDTMTELAGQVYPLLPLAVRLLVKQDAFAAFLLGNRERVVAVFERASAPSEAPR